MKLLKRLHHLGVVGLDLASLRVQLFGSVVLLQLLVDVAHAHVRVDVVFVQLNRLLVVRQSAFEVFQIVVGRCQVEVALRALVVDGQRPDVRLHCFFVPVHHVQSISLVVKSWCILWVDLQGRLV